jgi:hypothetical protein
LDTFQAGKVSGARALDVAEPPKIKRTKQFHRSYLIETPIVFVSGGVPKVPVPARHRHEKGHPSQIDVICPRLVHFCTSSEHFKLTGM